MKFCFSYLRAAFKSLFGSEVDELVIGKPFPWRGYAVKGEERMLPDLNSEGFDLFISLSHISMEERIAFCNEDIKLFVKAISGVRFIIAVFGDVLACDFALNIQKLKKGYNELWVKRTESDYVMRMFLVDADTTNLLAVRTCMLEDMGYFRSICTAQLHMFIEQVDSVIREVKSRYSMGELVRMADRYFSLKGITV